jgi:hypothetical protein
MPARSFTDRTGMLWRVSEIRGDDLAVPQEPRERRAQVRSAPRPTRKAARLETRPLDLPWLCFESRSERRRVSPVPAEWRELTDEELEDLMGISQLL